jgi:transglutaminase-like putative cysteine protease
MTRLTLGLAHELGLLAAMTASILIVLLGGEFPPWMWLTAFAPTLSMALLRRGVHVPAISGTLLGVLAIGAGGISILRGGLDAAVFAGGSALLGLVVARLLTRRTLAHDQQSLLLSLILVFAGSVLNTGMSYLFVFVAYAIAAVWALSTRQLLAGAEETGMSAQQARERGDVITPLFFAASAGVSVAVLGAALLIFVSFPRIGFGELGFLGRKDSQLPSSVDFGGNPRGLSTSTTVVARARGVPMKSFDDGLYLRSAVYDVVTLDAFSQSEPTTTLAQTIDNRPILRVLAGAPGNDVEYDVMVTPIVGSVIPLLGYTRTALVLSGGNANPNRTMNIGGRDRFDQLRTITPIASPLRYQVRGSIAVVGQVPPPPKDAVSLSDDDRGRYLALSSEDPAVRAFLDGLLKDLPADATTERRVAVVRDALLKGFNYSLEGRVAGRSAPLRAFLLDERAGHCELFAGGYALLLRMMGIPSRVIGGFQGGALADDGSVVFQLRHAHAWVEWWQDGVGWIVDDATPAATANRERLGPFDGVIERLRVFWDDRVVDYALEDQQTALKSVSQTLRGHNLGKMLRAAVVGVPVLVVVVLVAARFRRRQSGRAAGDTLARHIVDAAERWSGERRSPSMTVREIVEQSPHPVLRRALEAYEGVRFGGVVPDSTVIGGLVRELKALKAATR